MQDPEDPIPFPGSEGLVQRRTDASPAGRIPLPDAANDARLLAEVAAGHAGALAELYRTRGGAILALLRRMLGDEMEAEEVLQDTWVRIWQRAGSYNAAQSSPFTWMILLARGIAIERLRVRVRRAEIRASVSAAAAEPDWMQPGSSTQTDGFSHLDAREHAGRVEGALAGLPEEQRRALELAFFGGRTQEEIAQSTGQPLGTVKARIRRGMQALRRRLKGIHE